MSDTLASDATALFDAACDGTATDAAKAQLAALLLRDASMQAAFIRHMDLHAALIRHAAPNAELGTRSPERSAAPRGLTVANPTPRHASLQRGMVYALAASLVIAAAVAIYVFAFNSKPETRNSKPDSSPIATVIDTAAGGTLIVNDDVATPGQTITTGAVSLDTGSADLEFNNGVSVRITGRTRLDVHDPMHATLARGSAEFTCPPQATGYTVHLPGGARVVDLGTAFGVRIESDGSCRVAVTDGRVELRTADRRVVLLSARQHLVVSPDGQLGAIRTVEPAALVDHYPFDGDAADLAGDDATATVGQDVRFVDGRFGQAAQFPAAVTASNRIGVARSHAFDPGVGGFSIAFWVRRESAPAKGEPAGVIDALEGTRVGYHLAFGSDALVLRLDGPTTHVIAQSAVKPVDPSAFHHYAVTVDRTPGEHRVRFYEDGQPVASVPIDSLADADILSPSQDMAIGSLNGHAGLAGSLDDLRIYRGVLTPDEVLDLYDAGRVSPSEPSTPSHAAGTADRPHASSPDDRDPWEKSTPLLRSNEQ